MKPKRIAIASVLKPVDETRMARKIGASLAEAGYEVHIAGYRGTSKDSRLSQYPLFNFFRLSWKRMFAGFSIFIWFVKVNPDIIIVCTHELLIPAVLYKIRGAKIIYDVQENYGLNIRHTNAFPKRIRYLIALYVELKEWFISQFVDHFFLAESGYVKELRFIGARFTILENKALETSSKIPAANKPSDSIQLVFTGTIAETTGIFECIAMAEKLYELDTQITFTIAGFCHLPQTWLEVKKQISDKSWIKIIGGTKSVPHEKIIELLNIADAGFIYYPDQKLVENTVPTKLYEYLACAVPILLQDKESWLKLAGQYSAAIPIDPTDFKADSVLNSLKSKKFYIEKPGIEVLWKGEAEKMLHIMKTYF